MKTMWNKEAFNENQAKYSFLSILFPLTLFVMLPVWSRWLDDWYLLTMLIVIITVSSEVLLPSCLCLLLSLLCAFSFHVCDYSMSLPIRLWVLLSVFHSIKSLSTQRMFVKCWLSIFSQPTGWEITKVLCCPLEFCNIKKVPSFRLRLWLWVWVNKWRINSKKRLGLEGTRYKNLKLMG